MEQRCILLPISSTFHQLNIFRHSIHPVSIDMDNLINDYLKHLRYHRESEAAINEFMDIISESYQMETNSTFSIEQHQALYRFFKVLLDQFKSYGLLVHGNFNLNEINTLTWEIYDWLDHETPIFRSKDEFSLDQTLSCGLYFYRNH